MILEVRYSSRDILPSVSSGCQSCRDNISFFFLSICSIFAINQYSLRVGITKLILIY